MILVVEDHVETRAALLRLLQGHGLDAIGVADGAAAIQFLDEQRPHLIILDHMLPFRDGLGVLEGIRGDERTRSIPVLFYTANALPAVANAAVRLGAEVIVKGTSWSVLLACVDRHVRVHGTAHIAREVEPESAA